VLFDESGLLMAPLVRRGWSVRGQAPVLKQKVQHREKVSVAGGLWLAPRRDRLGLFYQTILNGYFDDEAVADCLGDLLEELGGPAVVVWDGGTMHKGGPLNALVARSRGRLALERLPAYAPELMPVEQVWTWLKYSRLCNFAPDGAQQLNEAIFAELGAIQKDQVMLQHFFLASDLPLPRALLF
jgi:putative transposase